MGNWHKYGSKFSNKGMRRPSTGNYSLNEDKKKKKPVTLPTLKFMEKYGDVEIKK